MLWDGRSQGRWWRAWSRMLRGDSRCEWHEWRGHGIVLGGESGLIIHGRGSGSGRCRDESKPAGAGRRLREPCVVPAREAAGWPREARAWRDVGAAGASTDEEVADSAEYRDVMYETGGPPVTDARGRVADRASAEVFDRFLDGVCLDR